MDLKIVLPLPPECPRSIDIKTNKTVQTAGARKNMNFEYPNLSQPFVFKTPLLPLCMTLRSDMTFAIIQPIANAVMAVKI